MKFLAITILLFAVVATASAQVATKFQLNANYGKGNVAYYPTSDMFWITKSAFTARSYPIEGSQWTRFYYPGPATNSTTSTVSKSSFDSLLVNFNSLTQRLDILSTNYKALETKTQTIDTSASIKVLKTGASLLKVLDVNTVIVRSLIPSADIDFLITDSTIQPIFKKH